MPTKEKNSNEVIIQLLSSIQQDIGVIKKDVESLQKDVRAIKEDLYYFKIEVDKRFDEMKVYVDNRFDDIQKYINEGNDALSMDIAEITTIITDNAVNKKDFITIHTTVKKHDQDILRLQQHIGIV